VLWDPQARKLVDASGVKDVILRVRGSPRSFTMTIERAAVKDYNVFAASFKPTDEWQELHVPLSSFKQIGYGKAIPTAWLDVKGMTLQARVAPGATDVGDFELEVDWIRME
jgi:hypothetical protein